MQRALLHLFFVGGLLILDAKFPIFIIGTGTVIFMAIVIGVVEAAHMKFLVDRSRPKELAETTQKS
jgi:hypothetical protein